MTENFERNQTAPTSNERTHELKVWPEFYGPLERGEKTFELRQDDRGFRAGDVLILREFLPSMQSYTGRSLRRRVTYLMSGPAFGLMKDYVCMALESSDETDGCKTCGYPHALDDSGCPDAPSKAKGKSE